MNHLQLQQAALPDLSESQISQPKFQLLSQYHLVVSVSFAAQASPEVL